MKLKHTFAKKILSGITAAAVAASAAGIMSVPVMAFDAPTPDNGAVGDISNGGEWTIYASKVGQIRSDSGAISDATESGIFEVTKGARSGALQFDLSTKDKADKVIKSAELRLTPVVSKTNLQQTIFLIDSNFTDTTDGTPIAQFNVPRVGTDDFNKDTNLQAITSVTEYPSALANWQTNIDITGEVIGAVDNMLSLHLAYASGNANKTEYATCNIANNGRLNGGAVPFLYSGGATDYSKWVYPQIIFTYTDEADYTSAYADFLAANTALSQAEITENNTVSAPAVTGGSTVTLSAADDVGIVKVENNVISYNSTYAGSAKTANVRMTVTKGEAAYSKVVAIAVNAAPSYAISFSADKNPAGEISVTVGNDTYQTGTAYAKEGGRVTVNSGANIGYTADITVKKADESEVEIKDGSFIMPAEPVAVSVEYTKESAFGTSRIAATNSVSIRDNGQLQSPDLVIGANRVTFVKFDLSNYNADIISNAEIGFSLTKNATLNTKAVFVVPNNDWNEGKISKDFCIDGTTDTNISAFRYTTAAGATATVSLLNGENHQALIIPDGNDASTAANGILKEYYVDSTGTTKTCNFNVTAAVKKALFQSSDKIITLMVYSTGGGNDVYSVNGAATLAARPSLTITESAEYLPDSELVTEIKTVDDLERFSEIVNGGHSYAGKTVTLANNLDLSAKYNQTSGSWTPIGTQDIGGVKPFAGTFDGANHSINGLYINGTDSTQGLFGIVTGTVQNLTVSGEITASSVAGGIAGWCSGNIKNCRSSVNITAQREAGGIAGTLNAGGVISDCANSGNIKINNKETYAGGITAHNIDSVVENCENTGKIENGSDGFRNKLGGIVGFLDNGTIRNSDNKGGEVFSNAEVASYTADESKNYVGGIVGYSSYGVIIGGSNSGAVHNAVDCAGGVAGFLQNGDIMFECDNSGNVSGKGWVGGVVGFNGGSSILDCQNDGTVSGTGEYIGGVVGYLSVGEVRDCSYDEALNKDLKIVGFHSFGTVTASENPMPTGYSVKYVAGNAAVSVAQGGEYTLIFASYDAWGRLLCSDVQTIVFDDAGKQMFYPQNFDAHGASSVKVMLWQSLDSMKSLCAVGVK